MDSPIAGLEQVFLASLAENPGSEKDCLVQSPVAQVQEFLPFLDLACKTSFKLGLRGEGFGICGGG